MPNEWRSLACLRQRQCLWQWGKTPTIDLKTSKKATVQAIAAPRKDRHRVQVIADLKLGDLMIAVPKAQAVGHAGNFDVVQMGRAEVASDPADRHLVDHVAVLRGAVLRGAVLRGAVRKGEVRDPMVHHEVNSVLATVDLMTVDLAIAAPEGSRATIADSTTSFTNCSAKSTNSVKRFMN